MNVVEEYLAFMRAHPTPWTQATLDEERALRSTMTQAERNEADFLLVNK